MSAESKPKKTWNIKLSKMAKNSHSKFSDLCDHCPYEINPNKSVIKLNIGDPSAFGPVKSNFAAKNALITAIRNNKFNGYSAIATDNAKASIAKLISKPAFNVKPKDVILAIGCSEALEVVIAVLGNIGDNILVPKPGYAAYEIHCKAYGIEVIYYDLMPEKNWEINLKQVKKLINNKTAAIIYNNPSNPCGSVYSKQHIEAFVHLAEESCVPIIADEVYSTLIFPSVKFTAISHVSKTVPIFTCDALSKRCGLPGWRIGWIHVHDPKRKLDINVRAALEIYAKRFGGQTRAIDAALFDILEKQPKTFNHEYVSMLAANANTLTKAIAVAPGVKCDTPKGGLFLLVKVEYRKFNSKVNSETKFIEALMKEESVLVTPGSYFGAAGYLRISLLATPELTRTAAVRLVRFCNRH